MTARQTLAGKQIVIGVTGSIAAVEMVRVIHALRRKGASIVVVMSGAACGIVNPDALTYASGHPVITRLTGMVEHVAYCGDGGSADLLLIAPCTANTIAKIACGVDDTAVTTFATTALGSNTPVIIVPAMHQSMYRHPAVPENIRRIKGWGVTVIEPLIAEGKAKIASAEEIVLSCERAILGKPLTGKKVLITSGPCREIVDDVRILTTRSSGQMGRELAFEAFRLGADVTVVHRDTFPCVANISAESADEMRRQVLRYLKEEGTDIYISAAAISDYAPTPFDGKIASGKKISIGLLPLSKLIDDVLRSYNPFTVAFKLDRNPGKKAKEMLRKGAAMVVANAPDAMGSNREECTIITPEGSRAFSGTKEEAAAEIWAAVLDAVRKRNTG